MRELLLTLIFVTALTMLWPGGTHMVEAAAKVRLNCASKTLCVQRTVNLKLKGTSKKVTWRSGNSQIATVSSSGKVTAVKAGQVTISATAGKKTYKCIITVRNHSYQAAANTSSFVCKWCGGKKTAPALVEMKKLDRYQYFRKYMTDSQMQQAYNEAKKIVEPLRPLERKDQLMGITVALRKLFEQSMEYSMGASHYNDPYGYLVLKTASCAGCARATGFCLNMLGIKYEHVNENQYSHQWARVAVGKEYWIADAFGLYCGPEPGVRKHPYLS